MVSLIGAICWPLLVLWFSHLTPVYFIFNAQLLEPPDPSFGFKISVTRTWNELEGHCAEMKSMNLEWEELNMKGLRCHVGMSCSNGPCRSWRCMLTAKPFWKSNLSMRKAPVWGQHWNSLLLSQLNFKVSTFQKCKQTADLWYSFHRKRLSYLDLWRRTDQRRRRMFRD